MKNTKSPPLNLPPKAPTGITGFDEMTGGGFSSGRATLLVGGPGSGKTIFALQVLVHGAKAFNEPGIFVAFEETPARIVANFETFGWNLAALRPKKLFILLCRRLRTCRRSVAHIYPIGIQSILLTYSKNPSARWPTASS